MGGYCRLEAPWGWGRGKLWVRGQEYTLTSSGPRDTNVLPTQAHSSIHCRVSALGAGSSAPTHHTLHHPGQDLAAEPSPRQSLRVLDTESQLSLLQALDSSPAAPGQKLGARHWEERPRTGRRCACGGGGHSSPTPCVVLGSSPHCPPTPPLEPQCREEVGASDPPTPSGIPKLPP